jgi:uncharacterized protein YcnI
MARYPLSALAGACALAFGTTVASAHVTLEQHEAILGGPVKLTFRVPHGCGDKPTLKLRVLIPDGVIAVKPMPKPGWTIDLVHGNYGKSYAYFHGVKLSEGTKEVAWSGNLPSEYYDEFVISGFVSNEFKPGTMLYFPVFQECDNEAHRWIEIPKAGAKPDTLKEPAPSLRLIAKP